MHTKIHYSTIYMPRKCFRKFNAFGIINKYTIAHCSISGWVMTLFHCSLATCKPYQ